MSTIPTPFGYLGFGSAFEAELPPKCLLAFLLLCLTVTCTSAKAKQHGQLHVQHFPHTINLERWKGRYDVVEQSVPFCLYSSNRNKEAVIAYTRLESNRSGEQPYALRHVDHEDQLLPVEITLKQNSNYQRVTYESPYNYYSIRTPQTSCDARDFHLQVKVTARAMSRLPSGYYQNHFDLYIDNADGRKHHQHFHIKLFIPRLIKIGLMGDVQIDKPHRHHMFGTTHACVYTNDGSNYRIKADSANYWRGSYHLCPGREGGDCQTASIPYEIAYEAYPYKPFRFDHPRQVSHSLQSSSEYFDFCSKQHANARIKATVANSSLTGITQWLIHRHSHPDRRTGIV